MSIPSSHLAASEEKRPVWMSKVRVVAQEWALVSEEPPISLSGMLVSQMWWRFVNTEEKFTGMSLPPRERFSSWRGWWMSPMNCWGC